MTDRLDLAEGRRLLAGATPGPWYVHTTWNGEPSYPFISDADDPENGGRLLLNVDAGLGEDNDTAGLIVWLRNNAAALLDAAERASRLREATQRLAAEVWLTVGKLEQAGWPHEYDRGIHRMPGCRGCQLLRRFTALNEQARRALGDER